MHSVPESIRRSSLASLLAATSVWLVACGGGGGDSSSPPPPPPPPTPTVTLSANPTSVTTGATIQLTWVSTNATTCIASGGWTGARATSGSETVSPASSSTLYTLACSGAGGSASQNATVTVTAPLVSISGSIQIPSVAQTDSDTNDIILTPVSNNTFQLAQAVPNPMLLGGYVNEPNTGPVGPLRTSGDVSDVYRVHLLAGQVIELTVANPAPAIDDLDLELYSSGQVLVNFSAGVERFETLTVAATGDYFVHVFAFNGASNYALSIGQTGSVTATTAPQLSDAFVPGELLVKLKAPLSTGSASLATKAATLTAHSGLALIGGAPEREMLMSVTSETRSKLAMARVESSPHEFQRRFVSAENRLKWETIQAMKRLAPDPEIAWVEPNWILTATAVPNDLLYARQRWHYELIRLPTAWNITTGSNAVIVAVIDSGVRPHSELGPKFSSGFDFVRGANAGDGNGLDPDASDPGTPVGSGFSFHGTHVAGTIAATSNEGLGVAGVAWGVRLMPIRTLGVNGSGSIADIIQGIRYAAGLANDSGGIPAQRADVINMSLGGPGVCPQSFQDAISGARSAGVIVVAAAGNDNTDGNFNPAGCAGVISVSAVDALRAKAPYSNFGTGVDIAAPGGNQAVDLDGDGYGDGIFSTHSQLSGGTYFSSYEYLQGTSMAAPHIAGVIALMKSVNPTLTPAEIDTLLTSGALTDDIGPIGPDALGVGLINAFKAVQAASAGPPPPVPPQLLVSPTTLNFGDVVTASEITTANSGNGALNVTATSTSAPWLTVTAIGIDANGLGRYRVQVNRAGLTVGTHNGWVEFVGNVGTAVRITVLMQVAASPVTADAGQHYLLLTHPETGESLFQVEVHARGASVAYTFTGVTASLYRLIAGTDLNNDGFICDDGEACGEYPVFGESLVIDASTSLTGIDFATGFRVSPDIQSLDASRNASDARDTAAQAISPHGIRRLR